MRNWKKPPKPKHRGRPEHRHVCEFGRHRARWRGDEGVAHTSLQRSDVPSASNGIKHDPQGPPGQGGDVPAHVWSPACLPSQGLLPACARVTQNGVLSRAHALAWHSPWPLHRLVCNLINGIANPCPAGAVRAAASGRLQSFRERRKGRFHSMAK